jgi:hypothetical protein
MATVAPLEGLSTTSSYRSREDSIVSYLLAVRKGEDVMSTMTGNMPRTILFGVIGTLVVAGAVKLARADVASDKPGAILVFPKIVVDTSGVLGPKTDTEIQITNTTDKLTPSLHGVGVRCFIVDATWHCQNAPKTACTVAGEADAATRRCGGYLCVQDTCAERDFQLTLTKRQPITWKASEGPSGLPAAQVQEDPFIGELKCIEADPDTFAPIAGLDPVNNNGGDLKGEATIVSVSDGLVDARKYNAIGIQAVGPTSVGDDLTLTMGGPDPQEYNGCPKALIVDSLFDNAQVSTHAGASVGEVTTDLTFVPCSEDLLNQVPTSALLQFIVVNEFEQRFSTSTGFSCLKEVQISDIDTRAGSFGNAQSIFNVAVEGTLSGQIRIRPVAGATSDGRVLAISEEFWGCRADDTACLASSTCPLYPDGIRRCTATTNVNIIPPPPASDPKVGNGDQLLIPQPD